MRPSLLGLSRLVTILCLSLICIQNGQAQSNRASITGTVVDSSGAMVSLITATVQHCNGATPDHAPNSPGSGSSFTISGIGSPRTIRAGRPLRVSPVHAQRQSGVW